MPVTHYWLSPTEEGAVRHTIANHGIATAVPRTGEFAHHPVLVIPNEVKAAYAQKPAATRRVLLWVVTPESAQEALLAAGCIAGLTENILVGAMYARFPEDGLDTKRLTGETRREQLLKVLGKTVADRDKREAEAADNR